MPIGKDWRKERLQKMKEFSFGVITVSDSRDTTTDKSGPIIKSFLEELGAVNIVSKIVRDNVDEIQEAVQLFAIKSNAVFLTGGTGLSPRDVTPEALIPILEKRANGIETLLTLRGLEKTDMAPLSRPVCGSIGACFIVAFPGSPKGAAEGIEILAPLLPHLLSLLAGVSNHDAC